MAQLNFNLSNASAPGPVTRRPSGNPGAGLQIFGRALQQSAQTLSSIGTEEDDITAMTLVTQYNQKTQQDLNQIFLDESDPHKQRQLIFDTINKNQTVFGKEARRLNVTKGFAQRATPMGIALQNGALKRNSGVFNSHAKTTIQASEMITESALLDPETNTIPVTPSPPTASGMVEINLTNPDLMTAQLASHFQTMLAHAKFLENPGEANDMMLAFGKRISDSIIDSTAKQHWRLFKQEKFAGIDFTLQVPVIDSDGKSTSIPVKPTQAQLIRAKSIADSQAATDLVFESNQRKTIEDKQDEADKKKETDLSVQMLSPGMTPGDRFNIIDAVRTGEEGFERSKNKLRTLGTLRQIAQQAQFSNEDFPEVVNPIREKLFHREPVSDQDMALLKSASTESTYRKLYDRWASNFDKVRTDVDEYKKFTIGSIKGLLGALPGRAFTKQIGVVSEAVLQNFMNQVLSVPEDQHTVEFINRARTNALSEVVNFIGVGTTLDPGTLEAVSPFNDIPGIGPENPFISGAQQINAAYLDPRDHRVNSILERDEQLFRYRLKKAISQQPGVPKSTTAPPELTGTAKSEWLNRNQNTTDLYNKLQELQLKEAQ